MADKETAHRAASLSLSAQANIDAPLNRRHDTARDRHNKQAPQPHQRGLQDEEDEDEVEVIEEDRPEKSNARQRKRKEMDRDADGEEVHDKRPQRGRQQGNGDSSKPHVSTKKPGEVERRNEKTTEEEEDEDDNNSRPPLHHTTKRVRHAVIAEDDSGSDGQQSEWTVGSKRKRVQSNEATKGSSRFASTVSLTGAYDSTTCTECRLMAKLHCSTKRCRKHCAKLGKRCDVHGNKGSDKVNGRAARPPSVTGRETIDIAAGEEDEDVPLRARVAKQRELRGEEEKEQGERKEEKRRTDDGEEQDEVDEEKGQRGGGDSGIPSRVQPPEHDVSLDRSRAVVGGQQVRPQRTLSKGSMDLSSVLRQQMEMRKALAEKQQLQQVEQQHLQTQSSAQRDYVSQALIESQLDEGVQLQSHVQLPVLQSLLVSDVMDERKQPPPDIHERSDVTPETPHSVHTTPASDRSVTALTSSPSSVDAFAGVVSSASLYLPAASEGGKIRLRGPPVVVLYALYIHCGSQVNAQRWLDGLPPLCKAGHVVADRSTTEYECSLCSCAARWEAAEDDALRHSMESELGQVEKEELSAPMQRLLADRGKAAVLLRRFFLQSGL